MKNQIKIFSAVFITCMAFCYLAIAFYKLSLNPANWGEYVRLNYCTLFIPISVFLGTLAATKPKNN